MEDAEKTKGLSAREERFALTREEAFRKVQSEVFSDYLHSPDPTEFMRRVRAYIDSNQESQDATVQGTVDAYEAFVRQVESI